MSKYNRVAHGNKVRTVQLYHHNLKLSQRLFGVIGMFEVALRNAIYNHYRDSFNDTEWITEQAAPGKLLQIFPNRCKGLKQTDVYNDLTQIREFRNRIAHHEPICFATNCQLSTAYVCRLYALIRTYLKYLGYDADKVLKIVEKPDCVLREIDRLAEELRV